MKIRNSLVSNSSSASFIVTWKYLNIEETNIKQILKKLIRFNPDFVLDIEKNTTQLKSGYFRSTFYTTIFNDMTDFDSNAAFLILALYIDNDFEIVDARIEDDQ